MLLCEFTVTPKVGGLVYEEASRLSRRKRLFQLLPELTANKPVVILQLAQVAASRVMTQRLMYEQQSCLRTNETVVM